MLIVHGCAVILFAILGIVFFCGKGSSLIAGYNTASPEEKAKYDEKALCHTMGGMMFACAACFGVLMPKPTAAGTLLLPRTTSMIEARSVLISLRIPVTPMEETT